jgi:hypothetical protein
MNKVQRFFLDFKNKKFKGADVPLRENVSYQKAKSVGILFNSENLESTDALIEFVKNLQHDDKQVKALTYINTKNKDVNHKNLGFNHHVITEKDVSMLGEITSFLVDDFVKTEFDYLFCIETVPSKIFENILLRSKAKFRIGRFFEEPGNFELMIKLNDNEGTDTLIRQMYYYIKTIKND